jgi:hypothetical protein
VETIILVVGCLLVGCTIGVVAMSLAVMAGDRREEHQIVGPPQPGMLQRR